MSATIGRIERRTISFRASPPRLSGTATRAISHPASWRSSIWRIVASTSWVSVVHIDWTATGAPSPIAVPPTQTRFDLRRGRGEARSSGRFRSTFIGASTTSSLDAVQGVSEHHPGLFRLPFLGFFEEAQEPWILVEGVVLVTARRLDDQQIPLGAGHLLIAVADARERRQEELPARAKLVPERSHLTREGFLERGRLRLAKPQDDHDCLRHVLLD